MLEQQVKEYEPKVTYYDKILQSRGTITTTQISKDYGMTSQKLNKILHAEGVQYKQSGQWLLYSKHQDKGYTKSHTFIDNTGETRMSTKWTQKGRLFIHNILSNKGIEALIDKEDLTKVN
ncbi:Phage antirepressor protein KilAC domain protein [compost metagenome]